MSEAPDQRIYNRMDLESQIMHRPDTYVGNMKQQTVLDYHVADPETNTFIHVPENEVIPGLIRCFVEILSNALDNVFRSAEDGVKMSYIKVTIEDCIKECPTGEKTPTGNAKLVPRCVVSVTNDGSWIPIKMHPEEKVYIPTLIFGELLTGSNYDDDNTRYTSGRNGYGAKLANIFAEEFSVEVAAPDGKGLKIFKQHWTGVGLTGNRSDPEITKGHGKPYTKITWMPALERFGIRVGEESEWPSYIGEGNLFTMYRLIYDAAMIASTHKVDVHLDDKRIPISGMKDYAKLFEDTSEMIGFKTKDSNVVVAMSTTGHKSVAFTNGVLNEDGGVHVDDWLKALINPILSKINKKTGPQITARDVRPLLKIFVNCTLDKPEFTSQTKTKLTSPRPTVKVESKQIKAMLKWSLSDRIKEILQAKDLLSLKKIEKKKKGFKKIEGYDPANNAGTDKALGCTLIFTEGLSAKTYAVRGIEVGFGGKKGRDWFGVFPLRGKLLNVRNAKTTSIAGNKEIANSINALGLRYGVDYTDDANFKKLNYGRIATLCDADVDGIHITGLLFNFFHHLFPSLLARKQPFLISMETPIVRVFEGPTTRVFYNERKFRAYASDPRTKKFRRKYYKGLGTSSNSEVMDSFGKKTVHYELDPETNNKMSMVFDSSKADARKRWLGAYDPADIDLGDADAAVVKMSFSNFIDGRMIDFSIDDCGRSIPHLLDGLKESQRKILYAIFKKPLHFKGKTLKVAQLAGYVAEHSGYHHGEQCLNDTIVKLASDVVGLNNIPFLFRDGQFGTRLSGGKDAAAGRYIFTKLDKLTRSLFPAIDDPLLPRRTEDGELIEPKFYLPIIPTILLNGCQAGIGTGWSCSVPLYNPLELVASCRAWMEGGVESISELKPWYRNFKGKIKKGSKTGRYVTEGVICRRKEKVVVTELPIGMWTDKFKDTLEDLLEQKLIKGMRNYSTPQKVRFEITEAPNGIRCTLDSLKLRTSLSTTNIVLFLADNKLKKFDTVVEVIDTFCSFRQKLYGERKDHLLRHYGKLLKIASNRFRFLTEVMNDDLVIYRRPEADTIAELDERDYDKSASGTREPDFDYLLGMDIRSFTYEKLEKIRREIEKHEADLKATEEQSPEDMWKSDLNHFEEEYVRWEEKMSY